MISTGRKNNISSGTFKHGRFIKKITRKYFCSHLTKPFLEVPGQFFQVTFQGCSGDLEICNKHQRESMGNLCGKWVNDNLCHLCLGSCRVWLKKCPVGNDESRLFFATSPIPMNGCLVLPREIIQLKPSF